MDSFSSKFRLLRFLIILIVSSICSANRRTCFTSLTFLHGTSPFLSSYDIEDDVHEGFLLSCKDGERLCCKNMVQHLNGVLGTGVAYIRGSAGTRLCNIVQREIVADTPTHVYASYYVSNCAGTSANTYLGILCCWEYFIGDQKFYVFNPDCKCGEKPDCHHNETTHEGPTDIVSTINQLQQPVDLIDITRDSKPKLEDPQMDHPSSKRKAGFRSGKLQGLHRMDFSDGKEEEEEMEAMEIKEKFLRTDPQELFENY